jgi:hypothetical protein
MLGWEQVIYLLQPHLLLSTEELGIPLTERTESSDLFGRKPILYGSIIVFLIGSALCGAAQSIRP